jgi:hypothetical protein
VQPVGTNPASAVSAVSKGAGLLGKLGKAGQLATSVSNVLGPVTMGLQAANMLYGAWNASKQAQEMQDELTNKAATINQQLADNSMKLNEDLEDVDIESQEQKAVLGENIGEIFSDATKSMGQIINRGRGLLTGDQTQSELDFQDEIQVEADSGIERLETQRGQEYASLIQPYQQQQQRGQQSLLNIAQQQKQLSKQDTFMENLLG